MQHKQTIHRVKNKNTAFNNSANTTLQLWRSIVPVLATSLVILLGIYWQTLSSMISTWWNIGTYTHGFVIFPISIWIIWTLKDSMTSVTPKSEPKAIIALLAVTCFWLIAHMGGLIGLQQFVLITLIQILVWTLLGKQVYKQLIFPLLFLYLAVPFGDFLIRPMMELTADITVILLRLTGIPVYRNGLFFMLPTGHWSVVEACSGVRYLIASFTVGVLFAYFCYSSFYKRLIFTAASIIIPVIANSLRAYLIVLIGHFSNMKLATGVDHFIYGWLFFGIIIAIMMWVGSIYQDPPITSNSNENSTLPSFADSSENNRQDQTQYGTVQVVMLSCLALLASATGPVTAYVLDRQSHQQINLQTIQLPKSRSSWKRVDDIVNWSPGYTGYALQLSSIYQSELGRVQLTMIFYPKESQGHELVNGQNSLFPDNGANWHLISESLQNFTLPPTIKLRESLIASRKYRLIWQFNWINGQFLTDNTTLKMIAVKNRLLGNNNHSIAVIISTPTTEDIVNARQRLSNFLQVMSAGIRQTVNQFNTLTTTGQ